MSTSFFRALTPATLLSILAISTVQPIAQSQILLAGQPASQVQKTKVTFVPPKKGQPRKTTGAASRDPGKCLQDQAQTSPYLIPLLPSQTEALTVSARPTLFAYIPPTAAKQVFFSVTNMEDGQHVYHGFMPISQSGILPLSLPADAPELEMKSYQWSLSLVCNAALAPDSPTIEGIIKRVPLDASLSAQLSSLSPDQQAAILGQQGIWYDMLASLAQSQQQSPNQGTESWTSILQSMGLDNAALEAVTSAPLLTSES